MSLPEIRLNSILRLESYERLRECIIRGFAFLTAPGPGNPGLDQEDLRQESAMVLWKVLLAHPELPDARLLAFWIVSFRNHLGNLRAHYWAAKRLRAITSCCSLDLLSQGEDGEQASSLIDRRCERSIRFHAEVEVLISRLPEFDRLVFLCFWGPDAGLARAAACRYNRTLTVDDISKELRLPRVRVRESFNRIRSQVRELVQCEK